MRIFTLAFVLFISLLSTNLRAAITITAVDGASEPVDLSTTTVTGTTTVTSTVKIFGGVAGSEACNSGSNAILSNGFCNSCTLAPVTLDCNEHQINDSMTLKITAKSDTASGVMEIRDTTNAAAALESVAYTAGQEVTLEIPWGDICQRSPNDEGTTCEFIRQRSSPSFTATFNVGVNTDGDGDIDDAKQITISVANIAGEVSNSISTTDTGIRDFALYPGDQKAYVETINLYSDSFPGANAKAIMFYYRPATNQNPAQGGDPNLASACNDDTPNINYQDAFIENELVEDENNAKDVESKALANVLTNGVLYAFRPAIKDEAGNIGLFYDPTNGDGPCLEFKQTVLPQQVNGLLSDTSSCFIATAAYGSYFEPHVREIRLFRDMYLAQTDLGKKIVNFYYAHSPKYAAIIRESSTLKAITRTALTPVWAFSYSMVHYGPLLTFILTTLILAALVGLIFSGRRLLVKK